MMNRILFKLFGKKIIDGTLERYGVSKTKVVAIVAVLVYAVDTLAPVFGWNIHIPDDVKGALMAAGLWSLKDGQPAIKV